MALRQREACAHGCASVRQLCMALRQLEAVVHGPTAERAHHDARLAGP